ncbi:hypothetical protein ACERZ8_07655 [Tateyamaria armeniaca]|uniref:Uncharacterized protein n=1 Tax=Tateyamaria armeniaca TaxID=2518930 RepID=A0ABW8URK3_9RHOB
MGKHLSFWIGFFAAALLVVPVAAAIMGVAEERLRDVAIAIFAAVAALVVVLVVVLFFRDGILRRLVGRSEATLEDVSGSLVDAVTAASKGDTDTAATHARALVQSGVGWYTWSNFYRWVIGTALGLLLAFGAFVGTVLLFEQTRTLRVQTERIGEQTDLMTAQTALMEAQTERLREQTEAAAMQNEILMLSLVSDLRARLLASAREVTLQEAMRQVQFQLPPSARLQNAGRSCEVSLNVDTTMTYPPNRATLFAIRALAGRGQLGEQIKEALLILLVDDEPAVVLGAASVLSALDVGPPLNVIQMDRVVVDELNLRGGWNLRFTNSIVQGLRCAECRVEIYRSLVHLDRTERVLGNLNFEIYGTPPFFNRYRVLDDLPVLAELAETIIGNEVGGISEEYQLRLRTGAERISDLRPFLNPLAGAHNAGAPMTMPERQCGALKQFADGGALFLYGPVTEDPPSGAVLDF